MLSKIQKAKVELEIGNMVNEERGMMGTPKVEGRVVIDLIELFSRPKELNLAPYRPKKQGGWISSWFGGSQ